MKQQSIKTRIAQRVGLGGIATGLGAGAAVAHGDHSDAGLMHALSHDYAMLPIAAILVACSAGYMVRQIAARKGDRKED